MEEVSVGDLAATRGELRAPSTCTEGRRGRGGDIAKEKLKVSKRRWPRTKESNAAAQEASIRSGQNEITGSRRINPGRAKTQGE